MKTNINTLNLNDLNWAELDELIDKMPIEFKIILNEINKLSKKIDAINLYIRENK
jgi:flagellar hook-associated protein FlgK